MKLFTKAQLKSLPKLYSQENEKDPIVRVKLFNPVGIGTWYIIEYDPEQKLAFGLCELQDSELGYVSIEELESLELPLGMSIERDIHFTPKKLSEIKRI